MHQSPIISIEDLHAIYKHADVCIFDASNNKNARSNYEQQHLEGAFFADINTQLADIKTDVAIGGRHPLPTPEAFAITLTQFGIKPASHVVIYDDNNGSNAAARFWWMLKAVGHDKVQVLNGGMHAAIQFGFSMQSGINIPIPATEKYPARGWDLPMANMQEVERVAQLEDYLVIDVRDTYRYDGISEPIDLIAGHIPGAENIPFTENLDANGLFLQPEQLREKYTKAFEGKSADKIIIHCGSGVTACHTLLALAAADMPIPQLYVGSWSEWSRNGKEIATTVS